MSTKPFVYQEAFPLAKDETEYYLLSKEHVSVAEFAGQEILKVAPEALTLLAQQAFHDAAFMLRVFPSKAGCVNPARPGSQRKRQIRRPGSSCATRKSRRKACCRPARTPVPRSSWVKKVSASGPAAAMKRRWPAAFTTPIPKITCATRKMPRWICTKRSTPGLTCRRRSIFMLLTATSTNSCAWRKAAVQPTKPTCIRKPKR